MWGGVAAVLLALWVGWSAVRPSPRAEDPGVALTTLVDKPAPVLQLPDPEGRRYTVPQAGRPTVLIFHMGFH